MALARFTRQASGIALAVILPVLVLVSFQFYNRAEAERQGLENLARARSEQVIGLMDAEVTQNIKLARILASSPALRQGDLASAHERAKQYGAVADSWRAVRLTDYATGNAVFDTREPLRNSEVRPTSRATAKRGSPPELRVGNLEKDERGDWAVKVEIPVRRSSGATYLMTLELNPVALHAIASSHYPTNGVSAVVDGNGRFISRSLAYPARLGSLSTRYVQEAVRRGGEGLYRGKTLEGFDNFTAYKTSALTGWSAHVAVSSAPFDAARGWSLAVWTVVVIACCLVSGVIVWLTLRDMARARREEERQRQSQKMEALGHLTGGIAHDFNNLLTAIIGGLDLVLQRAQLDSRSQRYVEGALAAAQRGAKLTSRLLAFSRTQKMVLERVDLLETVRGMVPLLEHSIKPEVSLELRLSDAARWAATDKNQLELALLNLVVNADDALSGSGKIVIETGWVTGKQGECIALSVRDNGAGMPPSVRDQAFDPFFTTKGVNKGTGLGLAQVYSLAKQSGGEARIESEVGGGTCVTLLLRVSDAREPSATERPEPELRSPPINGSGTVGARVLVLDDDPEVREVVVEGLRARGYIVFQSDRGEDALRVIEGIDPDLVLLDYLMPEMNGAEVVRRVRVLRPHQRMGIISGHLDSGDLAEIASEIPILQKPFDGATLANFVTRLLNQGEVRLLRETSQGAGTQQKTTATN